MDDHYKVSEFNLGDEVHCVGEPDRIGTIVEIGERHSGIQWYRVNFGKAERPKIPETDLRLFVISASPYQNLIDKKLNGYREFQRLITFLMLLRERPLRNTIYAFNASRTRFYPHQFKPLLKYLNSPIHRLLIADEVGLGKTIEAGLIITELRARQPLNFILIVCPANLTGKWQMELKRRFDEKFRIINANDLIELLEQSENPYKSMGINGIISLESIRKKEVLKKLENLLMRLDLVIVDEAHHMRNFNSKSRKAGVLLNRRADSMLFLTATPIHLGSENLYSLLNVLDPEEFSDINFVNKRLGENEPIVKAQICMGQVPPNINRAIKYLRKAAGNLHIDKHNIYQEIIQNLKALRISPLNENQAKRLILDVRRGLAELNLIGQIFTRSKKREVLEKWPVRKAYRIKINLTRIEKKFYDAVTDYVRAESGQRKGLSQIQELMLIMPQRRAASSIPAMVRFYKENVNLDNPALIDDLDLTDENFEEGALNKTELALARKRLKTVLEKWPNNEPDSKYNGLIKKLKALKKENGSLKVIVFAFFKDTLLYLKNRLIADGFKCDIINGDVKPKDRTDIIRKFKEDPDFEILLSSKVGSEGLDLQFCNTIFNYDLPWNPMEIEQRIGRVDRIGQKSRIIRIYNFWINGTIEKKILSSLLERIKIFQKSIGELELILGDELRTIERDILCNSLTQIEEDKIIKQKQMIIENRKNETEKLEKNAAKFIGTDQFFNLEIDKIRERRRFITGEQLKRFLIGFIETECPNSRLCYKPNSNFGYLYPDSKLANIIKEYGNSTDLSKFLYNIDAETPITFDSNVAFDYPDYEYINFNHVLIQSIVKYYSNTGNSLLNAHFVALKTKKLKNGQYFYFIYRLRIKTETESDTFELVILDKNLNIACNDDDSEIILGEMVEKGKDSKSNNIMFGNQLINAAIDKSSNIILDRITKIRDKQQNNIDVFINKRIESLEYSYQNYTERHIPLYKDNNSEKKINEKYNRMLRGKFRKYDIEFHKKIKKLENMRKIQVEYDDISAGILKVI